MGVQSLNSYHHCQKIKAFVRRILVVCLLFKSPFLGLKVLPSCSWSQITPAHLSLSLQHQIICMSVGYHMYLSLVLSPPCFLSKIPILKA